MANFVLHFIKKPRHSYDYGFRIYNPGIGKFLSVDPLTKSYPWYTPYQFAGNKPIWAVDLDGLEEKYSTMQMENELALTVANTVALAWEGLRNTWLTSRTVFQPQFIEVSNIKYYADLSGVEIPENFSDDDIYQNYKLRYSLSSGTTVVPKEGFFS